MQQPSVANYFKIKKRIRDEPANSKSSKVVAVSGPSETVGGLDKPKPIRVTDTLSTPSPETVIVTCPITSSSVDIEIDRKTAKGRRRIPCFQKYHHLISTPNQEDVDMAPASTNESQIPISSAPISLEASMTTNLPLPYKFKLLMEHFRAVETIASIFYNRNEVITFNKIKPAVLELVRSTQLREKHLAQFLTVLPNCYNFTYEKMSSPGSREMAYQLVIVPNLAATSLPNTGKMTSALIAERRNIFQNKLMNICHKYHKEFLLSLHPPIVLPPDSQVTRWHPKFAINEIPNIEPEVMPKSPDSGSISATTAKQVIARARDIMDAANPRMRNALQELMKKTAGANAGMEPPPAAAPSKPDDADLKRAASKEAILKAQQALMLRAKGNSAMQAALNKVLAKNNKGPLPVPAALGPNVAAPSDPEEAKTIEQKENPFNKKSLAALKGVSQSLIDKIRAREQEKAIRGMTLSPKETKDQAMLNRLPEFVKIVRNTMVAENKSVLALPLVVERLFHSQYQALSHCEAEDHLRLLNKTVPDWLTLLKTSQGEFVKINKETNINTVVEKIYGIIRKSK